MNFVINHAPGARLLARPVDQKSSTRYHCTGLLKKYNKALLLLLLLLLLLVVVVIVVVVVVVAVIVVVVVV